MDLNELRERQAWPLSQKIDHALFTIETFLARTEGKAYVAFSGGKDSSVLLDLVRIIDPTIPAVFVNTGNEWPDIIKFVRHLRDDKGYNILEIHPKMKPRQVWEKYGFPLVSKDQAYKIQSVRTNPNSKESQKALSKNYTYHISDKWKFLTTEIFDTSKHCCHILKKKPSHKYEKETGRNPILGTLASESVLREKTYIRRGGCNSFGEDGGKKMSTPLAIWTDDDIWAYIKKRNLEIAEIYYKGVKRTGCVGCGFGCQYAGDDRFNILFKNYPKYYGMVMNYTNNGVTFREAVRKVMAVNHLELPDENGEIYFPENKQ